MNRRSTGSILDELARVASGPAFVAVGDRITASGRKFTAVAVMPYQRADGGQSQLVTWRSRCATCEAPYEIKGSRNAAHLPVNCPSHRGRRTRHSKRRRELRQAIERAIAAIDAGDTARARATLAALLGAK